MIPRYYCDTIYRFLAHEKLRDFAIKVQESIVRNTVFLGLQKSKRPPISIDNFNEMVNSFQMAYMRHFAGKSLYSTELPNAKQNLLKLLHKTALYVDAVAEGNEDIIIKAGFQPIFTSEQPVLKLMKTE